MNHATLRRIAAATAVVCRQAGGRVSKFLLLKTLYLSDREMISEYGAPITGDTYSSMPKGPILCATYDLLVGKLCDQQFQTEWNEAFAMKGNYLSSRGEVDTDCLSQAEIEMLVEKTDIILRLDKDNVVVADWMHEHCPEWQQVASGSSRPLPISRILEKGKGLEAKTAKVIEAQIREALVTRNDSVLARNSLLAV